MSATPTSSSRCSTSRGRGPRDQGALAHRHRPAPHGRRICRLAAPAARDRGLAREDDRPDHRRHGGAARAPQPRRAGRQVLRLDPLIAGEGAAELGLPDRCRRAALARRRPRGQRHRRARQVPRRPDRRRFRHRDHLRRDRLQRRLQGRDHRAGDQPVARCAGRQHRQAAAHRHRGAAHQQRDRHATPRTRC